MSARPSRSIRAALTAGLVLLAACSGSDDDASDRPSDDRPAVEATQVVEVTMDGTGSPMSVEVPEEPLAVVPTAADGIEMELYLARRDGETVTVVWAYHNTTDEESGFTVSPQFIDPQAPVSERLMSGIWLVDTERLEQHLVLREAGEGGVCACSNGEAVGRIEPGERFFAMAMTSAPPASTKTVTVGTPVAAVPDVELTEGEADGADDA